MDQIPGYVSILFLLTTFVTVALLLYGVRKTGLKSIYAKALIFLVPFWLIFQAALSLGGFFQNTKAVPPRIFLFGLGPALAVIFIYFAFARDAFIAELPIRVLTIIHFIRIPVELTLHWLYEGGIVPGLMTFHGTNFDILSGLTAPIAYYFAFRGNTVNKPLLVVWNILALCLVLNVVITAILCIPTPLQQFAFDQPNRAVLYFPFVWLATVVVPIVFFCHFASLYKLAVGKVQ